MAAKRREQINPSRSEDQKKSKVQSLKLLREVFVFFTRWRSIYQEGTDDSIETICLVLFDFVDKGGKQVWGGGSPCFSLFPWNAHLLPSIKFVSRSWSYIFPWKSSHLLFILFPTTWFGLGLLWRMCGSHQVF